MYVLKCLLTLFQKRNKVAVANKLKPQYYSEYIFKQIQHGKDKIPKSYKNKAQIRN